MFFKLPVVPARSPDLLETGAPPGILALRRARRPCPDPGSRHSEAPKMVPGRPFRAPESMPGLPNRACSRRTVAIREIRRRNPISPVTKMIRRSHREPFCIAVAQKCRQNFLFRGRRQWPQAISSVPLLRSGLGLEKYSKTVGFLLGGGRICIMGFTG